MIVVLSEDVEKDLKDIFDYTFHNYGESQAIDYVSSFDLKFDQIRLNPLMGRNRPEIRKGLRSTLNKKHIIFYKIEYQTIQLLRILHSSRDLKKHL